MKKTRVRTMAAHATATRLAAAGLVEKLGATMANRAKSTRGIETILSIETTSTIPGHRDCE